MPITIPKGGPGPPFLSNLALINRRLYKGRQGLAAQKATELGALKHEARRAVEAYRDGAVMTDDFGGDLALDALTDLLEEKVKAFMEASDSSDSSSSGSDSNDDA